jgi:hypothetical protein
MIANLMLAAALIGAFLIEIARIRERAEQRRDDDWFFR